MSNLCPPFLTFCLSFTKQVNYKVSEKLCTFVIAEQSNWSRKISLAITRQIEQEMRHEFTSHKNNCCQVFSRSRNDQPLFVNEYKVNVGWQSSSLENKFSGFRRAKHKHLYSKSKPIQTILHDFLRTCEYLHFRWTLRLFYLCLFLVFIDR